MRQKFYFLFFFLFPILVLGQANTEKVETYFQRIRNNDAMLQAFFLRMPKGGDVHTHFSGAPFGEFLFENAVKNNLWIDKKTGEIFDKKPNNENAVPIQSIRKEAYFADLKDRAISLITTKNYTNFNAAIPPNTHFFNTFSLMNPMTKGFEPELLKEMKKQALLENVQYLEIMFIKPSYDKNDEKIKKYFSKYDSLLISFSKKRGETDKIFEEMYQYLVKECNFSDFARKHSEKIANWNRKSRLENAADSNLTVRYLNYCPRTTFPTDVFAQMLLGFLSSDMDTLLVGENIVAPENADVALRDCWLHMQMFGFFHKKFPQVKISIHAGELTPELVTPQDLSWHIEDAVRVGKANRIGHGVAIPYESRNYETLKFMRENKIAVEINLSSNEFILGVKNSEHPVMMYLEFGVPVVISTDDAGILRTTHSYQYFLLGKRYNSLTYKDIKQIVYNGIIYSFLKDSDKEKAKKLLDQRFATFEKMIVNEVMK